jgi:DNA-binding transcriptional ArsR family regulator
MSQCSLIAKSASKHNNQIRLVEPDRAAFSDRLWRIIRATVALEPVCVADIADCNNVKLTPVSINRYLLMLVRAGIVVRKRKGSYYVYSVSEEHRKEVEKVCDAFHLLERIVGEVECVENAFEDSALEGEIFDD